MKTSVLLIAGITVIGMMASCASDNGDFPNNKGEKATVKLSLATSVTTRTTTATDGGGTIGTDEGQVNNLAIGLFDNGNNRVSATGGKSETTDYKYSDNGFSQISTTSNATKIAVIANVPGVATTKLDMTNAKTYAAFGSNYNGALLVNTTSADGGFDLTSNPTSASTVNSQKISGLPMYGESAVNWTTSNTSNNAVNVTLVRMVSRICLTKLATDFSAYTDPAATFTPTEVFMYNVKDELTNWQSGATASSYTETTSGPSVSGKCEMTDRTSTTLTSNAAPSITPTDYAYLSSGSAIPAGWVTTNPAAPKVTYLNCTTTFDANALSFYVFPNTDTSVPTKIIIKGVFTTGGNSAIVYYPVIINHASSYNTVTGKDGTKYTTSISNPNDSQISANTIYNLYVTIEGRGVAEPYMPLEPSTVKATMQVTPWDNTTQDVTIP